MDIHGLAEMLAEMKENERSWLLGEALKELEGARRAVADLRVAQAIAGLRKLAPEARRVRFTVRDREFGGGSYAVVTCIDGVSADDVLFELDGDAEGMDVDGDELTPVEDFLAAAAELGATFEPGGYAGEFFLSLVR